MVKRSTFNRDGESSILSGPTKVFAGVVQWPRIADFQSADGSSILLAGTICPVRPMDQDRTLRTFRFGFESRAGYQVVKRWPSGKGTSLSMRIRWVRLPSTSPSVRRCRQAGLSRLILSQEIAGSNPAVVAKTGPTGMQGSS